MEIAALIISIISIVLVGLIIYLLTSGSKKNENLINNLEKETEVKINSLKSDLLNSLENGNKLIVEKFESEIINFKKSTIENLDKINTSLTTLETNINSNYSQKTNELSNTLSTLTINVKEKMELIEKNLFDNSEKLNTNIENTSNNISNSFQKLELELKDKVDKSLTDINFKLKEVIEELKNPLSLD